MNPKQSEANVCTYRCVMHIHIYIDSKNGDTDDNVDEKNENENHQRFDVAFAIIFDVQC